MTAKRRAAPGEPALDPLIHELARLRICAALRAASALDSATLRDTADLSDSALSKHLKRLVEAGYVEQKIGQATGRGRPRTWVSLTAQGRSAYDRHVAELRRLTGT
jgi:DNA-binding MarR family transcriptional regulator